MKKTSSRNLASTLTIIGACGLPLVALTGCNEETTPTTRIGASVVPLNTPEQQAEAPAESPARAPSESPLVSGEISSVSSDELVVEKSQSGEKASITLTEDTIVMVDGKSAETSDLKEGQLVIASTERQGADVVAISVSARSATERSTD
ncbi:MAG: hypothetical protein ACREIA_05430 [Opitutaceae bacterium]